MNTKEISDLFVKLRLHQSRLEWGAADAVQAQLLALGVCCPDCKSPVSEETWRSMQSGVAGRVTVCNCGRLLAAPAPVKKPKKGEKGLRP